MNCNKCGSDAGNGAFCPNCGAPVGRPAAPPQGTANTQNTGAEGQAWPPGAPPTAGQPPHEARGPQPPPAQRQPYRAGAAQNPPYAAPQNSPPAQPGPYKAQGTQGLGAQTPPYGQPPPQAPPYNGPPVQGQAPYGQDAPYGQQAPQGQPYGGPPPQGPPAPPQAQSSYGQDVPYGQPPQGQPHTGQAPPPYQAQNGQPPSYGQPPQPPKKKMPRWLLVTLIVVGALVLLGTLGAVIATLSGGTANSSSASASASMPSSASASAPMASASSAALASSAPAASSRSASTATAAAATPEEVTGMIESVIAQNFNNYSIEYDEASDSIILSLWDEGLTAGAMLAGAGDAETLESWEYMRDSIAEMGSSCKTLVDSTGLTGTSMVVNVLNDQNLDNVILSVIDGVIVYDVTRE